MACADENELLELADGLLPATRRAELTHHVDECARCRAALAAIARTDDAVTVAEPLGRSRERPPAELLREYLRADAPARELKIAMFVAGVAVLALCSLGWAELAAGPPLTDFATRGAAIAAAVLAYETTCIVMLRRGRFSTWLPIASAIVEISFVMAMQLAATVVLGDIARVFPGAILLGALIVISALRVEPRLCLAIGVVAAIEMLALGVVAAGHTSEPDPLRGHAIRAVFCAVAGVGGMMFARYQIERSEGALRAIREQDLFGKYLVHERLGRGGMGEVFRATYCPEGGFVRTVALKRMRADLSSDPKFAAYFRSEVQLGASLVHPNIVQLLDCGRFRGAFVVAMELVDGASLAAILLRARAPLAFAAVSYLGAELAAALDYVHRKRAADGRPLGLVHCDVNPPNVLVSRLGEVKLADFGVAQAADSAGHAFAGKLAYAAPEQLASGPLDARTDLYALGVTLYEVLVGRPPSAEAGDARPSRARPDVPAALDELVAQLLAREPGDRPRDAASVHDRLLALDGAGAPYPEGERLLARAVEAVSARDRDRAS